MAVAAWMENYLPLHIFIHSLLQLCVRILAFSSLRCLIVCGRACNKFFSAITFEMCTDNWIDDDVALHYYVFVVLVRLFLFANLLSILLLLSVSLSFASYHVKQFDCNSILISIGPMGSIIQYICTLSAGIHSPHHIRYLCE